MATLTICRKGVIPLIASVFLFIMANLTFAETKVFIEEYTYQASEADSKLSSRAISLEQVKRLLLEKLGTYLESETEVKNFHLSKDQILILTAGIIRAEIIDEKWDGKTYSLVAKIAADPRDVVTSIDKLRQDRQKTKELVDTRKRADAALKEIERLKRELKTAKAGKPEQNQYQKAVNGLMAIAWFERGYELGISRKNQEAIEALTRAIELDPKYGLAYYNRGVAFGIIGDKRQEIRDYDRAIELNPKEAVVYYNRGATYEDLGDHQQAIKDFDKAIELDPKYKKVYVNRGIAYAKLGDHQQAIKDFDRAIELNPKDAGAYYNRGIAYSKLRSDRQAIRDYDRAIELNPKLAQAYNNRGIAYAQLRDHQEAIRNFNRAIELDPKFAEAYANRGNIYLRLGNDQSAFEDFKTAAKLGYKPAQDFLRSKGFSW